VDHDIRILGERKWRNLALNTKEWRKLFEEGQVSCRAIEPTTTMMMVVIVTIMVVMMVVVVTIMMMILTLLLTDFRNE
jgi:hypothetical protein